MVHPVNPNIAVVVRDHLDAKNGLLHHVNVSNSNNGGTRNKPVVDTTTDIVVVVVVVIVAHS
jgi:hypothetical protein